MDLTDFFPRPKHTEVVKKCKQTNTRETIVEQDELKKWLVRRVECIRGSIDVGKSNIPISTVSQPPRAHRLTLLTRCRNLPGIRLRSC